MRIFLDVLIRVLKALKSREKIKCFPIGVLLYGKIRVTNLQINGTRCCRFLAFVSKQARQSLV